jgi:hypothetical protein
LIGFNGSREPLQNGDALREDSVCGVSE